MQTLGGKPNAWDRFFFQWVIVALFGAFAFSRVKLPLVRSYKYNLHIYPDVPIMAGVVLLFACALVVLGSRVRIRTFAPLWPLPLLLIWILGSILFFSLDLVFSGYGFAQWILAFLGFLFIPPILQHYRLGHFAQDAFLGWSIAAAIVHFLVTIANPIQLLEGASSVFAGNRAHPGLYFLLSFAVAFASWRERARRLYVIAMALSILGVLISGSRAAQMGMAVFLGLVMLFSGSKKVWWWGVPTLIGLGLLVRAIVQVRSAHTFEIGSGLSIDASSGIRLLIWVKCWEIITMSTSNFLVGIGYGNFQALFYKLVEMPIPVNAAHNVYLHYWVETGLVGLLLVLLLFSTILFLCWRLGKRSIHMRYLGYFTVAFLFTGLTQESLLPSGFLGNFIGLYFVILGIYLYEAKTALLPASASKPRAAPLS